MSSGNSRSSSGKSIWNKLHKQTSQPPSPTPPPPPPQPPPREHDDGSKGQRNGAKYSHGNGYRSSISSINTDYQPQAGGSPYPQQGYEGHMDRLQMSTEFPPPRPGSSRGDDGYRSDYHHYPYPNYKSAQHDQFLAYPPGSRPPPSSSSGASYLSQYNQPRYNTPGSTVSVMSNSSGTSSNARSSTDQGPIPGAVMASTRGSILFGNPDMQSFNSSTFSPQEFNFPRPHDDRIIEQLFLELMIKRGWTNLPEQARRQMQAYPADKKWTLVHQDKLTEWQADEGGRGGQTGAQREGSPEWFVKKVFDRSITTKQLQSLSVSLRTQPIKYINPNS